MKITIKEQYLEEHTVCYAIVFDTGFFYIGATTHYNTRIKQHIYAIKKDPEKYLIGLYHNPKKCTIVKLLLCHDKGKVFQHERELLLIHSNNRKMINLSPKYNNTIRTSLSIIKETIKKIDL